MNSFFRSKLTLFGLVIVLGLMIIAIFAPLIATHDPSEIDIDRMSLNSVARGERIDYNKHDIKGDVKAVTYHNLQVKKTGDGYRVRVILDL